MDNYRFAESDSLLCYHGPMLYEAKCLKRRKSNDGKAQYYIHYKGWNSKWEEWVDDDRVLAVNTVNMNKMAALKELHSSSKKSGAKRSINVIKEETARNLTPVRGRKRKHSEISSESTQTANAPSPAEPKPKKRVGRPPKTSINKTEVIDTPDATTVSEAVEVTKVTRSFGAYKMIGSSKSAEANKVTGVNKSIKETKTAKETKREEPNKNVEITEVTKVGIETELKVATGATDIDVKPNENVKTTDVVRVNDSEKGIEAVKSSGRKRVCGVTKKIVVTKTVKESERTKEIKETEKTDSITRTDTKKSVERRKLKEAIEKLEMSELKEIIEETEGIKLEDSTEETESKKTIDDTEGGTILMKSIEETEIDELTASIKEAGLTGSVEENELTESIENTDESVEFNEETEETELDKLIDENEKTELIMGSDEETDRVEFKEPIEGTELDESIDETERAESTELLEETEGVELDESVEEGELDESVEETEGAEMDESIEEGELDESVEETEGAELDDLLDEAEDVEFEESIEEVEGAELDESVEDSNDVFKNFFGLFEETDEDEEIEHDPDNIFTVPAPVRRVVPAINMPNVLKRRIAYDFNMTMLNNKILKFPVGITVEKLIRSYICSKSRVDMEDKHLKFKNRHSSFNLGLNLLQYFNVLIHTQLLYNVEREYGLAKKAEAFLKRQLELKLIHINFEKVMYPKDLWHYVYSPTYLLRLFIKIPEILTASLHMYNDKQIALIILIMEDLLKFAESRYDEYFTDEDYIGIE